MTISKKKASLGSALQASIGAEEKSVENRFAKAEAMFAHKPVKTSRPKKLKAAKKVSTPKPKRVEKVIRDTFTMPEKDHDRIAALQQQALKQGLSFTKSEIVRAGLIGLQKLSPKVLSEALQAVEKLKQGRPSK